MTIFSCGNENLQNILSRGGICVAYCASFSNCGNLGSYLLPESNFYGGNYKNGLNIVIASKKAKKWEWF